MELHDRDLKRLQKHHEKKMEKPGIGLNKLRWHERAAEYYSDPEDDSRFIDHTSMQDYHWRRGQRLRNRGALLAEIDPKKEKKFYKKADLHLRAADFHKARSHEDEW